MLFPTVDTKFVSSQQRLAKIDTILWLLLSFFETFRFRKLDIPRGGTKKQSVTCTA